MPMKWARPAKKGDPLTVRECEVALLLTDGLSNKLIADKLGLAEHTSKFHVTNVIKKLGASTRVDAAVIYARRLDAAKRTEERDAWSKHSNELALQVVTLQAKLDEHERQVREQKWFAAQQLARCDD